MAGPLDFTSAQADDCLMAPIIRRAKPGDARSLHEAHMRSIKELCRGDYTAAQIEAWGGRKFDEAERLRTFASDYVWVIDDGGAVSGFGHFFPTEREGDKFGWIVALYLTPEVVGLGMGKRMLALIEAEARRLGLKRIELESTRTALGFYKLMGFKETGPQRQPVINGIGIHCFPMSKDL